MPITTDPKNYNDKHDHLKFDAHIKSVIADNSKVLFVKHHQAQYGGHFPIWVIMELFTFGMISYFYADLTSSDRKELAKEMYGTTSNTIISWLRCCTDLRNICAHYGRLYYRVFPAIPAGIEMPESSKLRLWGALLVVKELYPDMEKWNAYVLPSIKKLFKQYKNDIDLDCTAFPKNWVSLLQKKP